MKEDKMEDLLNHLQKVNVENLKLVKKIKEGPITDLPHLLHTVPYYLVPFVKEQLKNPQSTRGLRMNQPRRNSVAALIQKLSAFENQDEIICAPIWSVKDVLEHAKEQDILLTNKQAEEVLILADSDHDSSIGISWETIDKCISEILGV